MSRFFEFLEKLNGESTAVRPKTVATSEALHILPVLHPPNPESSPKAAEQVFQLRHVEVDRIQVSPESRLVFHNDPGSPAADRFRFCECVFE